MSLNTFVVSLQQLMEIREDGNLLAEFCQNLRIILGLKSEHHDLVSSAK